MKRFLSALILAAALAAFPVCVHALALSDIRTQIRRTVDDNPTDTSFRRYSDTFLLSLINEGQKEVVNLTWLAEKPTSYALTSQTSYYNLPTDFLAVTQVYYFERNKQLIELSELSQKALYDQFPTWEAQGGTPVNYWVSNATNPASTSPMPKRISYFPVITRQSTGTVTVWYLHQVADLSGDSDTPFDGRQDLIPYHNAIVYYVVMRIKLIEGKDSQATVYQTLYTNSVNVMNDRIGRRPNYTPSMGVGSK